MSYDNAQVAAAPDPNVNPAIEMHAAASASIARGASPASNLLEPAETTAALVPMDQVNSPSAMLPPDPAAQSTLVEAFRPPSMSGNNVWPKEWKDDNMNTGKNLESFLAHMREREAYYDSIGVPCCRVAKDAHGKMQPRQWVSLQAANSKLLDDNLDTEYVCVSREVPADQVGKSTVYKMVGNLRQGVDVIIIPKEEVAAHEAQGWEVWYAPSPPLDIENNYKDTRTVDRPVDVVSYDRPTADTMRYLEHGNNLISSAMTDGNWRPGQLIGKNGSDPATMAQSPSFAPPDRHDQVSESRSATSTGHVLQHARPAGVCYGWGDYDQHTHWQSFGRRVTKDMVEKQNWPTDPLAPIRFVNESNETKKTFNSHFTQEDVSSLHTPVSLHELLNSEHKRKFQGSDEGESAVAKVDHSLP
ncbi:hypothetical protein EsH8_X_000496 [Colletotrichum jinshuiense]